LQLDEFDINAQAFSTIFDVLCITFLKPAKLFAKPFEFLPEAFRRPGFGLRVLRSAGFQQGANICQCANAKTAGN
jgi:hypothetical protein